VELGDDRAALLARDDLGVAALDADGCGKVEPGLEGAEVGEDVGEEEVEERPELAKVVLEGRAREEELVVGAQRAQLAQEAAVPVLQAVPLVDDDVPVGVVGGGWVRGGW
jgi:hypothetical protein